MKQNPDILIVGGGLIGMLSAWELARAGFRVSLLERGDTGRESSWAGGGILSPLYPWRYDDAVSRLASWSQSAYPGLLAELHDLTGIDPEWQGSGLLVLDVDDVDAARSWSERFSQSIEWLTPADWQQLAPSLGLTQAGQSVAWLPGVGQLRNPRFVQALRRAVELAGVALRTQVEVSDFVTSAGRIRGVLTTAGEHIAADKVVIAGGAWSGELLAKTGIRIEVEPVRGQMLLYRAEPGLLNNILLYQSRYVIPRQDGRILVGSTLEHVGFDKQTTDTAHDDLQAAALELLPALAGFPIEHHWAGLRPGSPKGIPYIGEHPEISGLFMNCGHFRNGVVLAPGSVRILLGLLKGETPAIDPTPYMVINH
jgi:glycine oxidase